MTYILRVLLCPARESILSSGRTPRGSTIVWLNCIEQQNSMPPFTSPTSSTFLTSYLKKKMVFSLLTITTFTEAIPRGRAGDAGGPGASLILFPWGGGLHP